MRKWKRKSRRTLVDDRWLRFHADACELPTGTVIEPFYVLEEKEWAHVVAIDDSDRILLTRQYRYAADRFCTELPCGVADPGEDPFEAAKRELQEETGYVAAEWIPLGALYANPARQTNRMHCFLARGLEDTGQRALEESEEIEYQFVTRDDLRELIRSGEFCQSLHVACYFLAQQYLDEGQPTGGATQ